MEFFALGGEEGRERSVFVLKTRIRLSFKEKKGKKNFTARGSNVNKLDEIVSSQGRQ